MTNTFMAMVQRDQANLVDAAIQAKNELVIVYTADKALCRPTPTTAELNAIASGTPTNLAADGSNPASPNKRPGCRSLYLGQSSPMRS